MTRAMEISWHETNLKNLKATLESQERELLALQDRVKRTRAVADHLALQIETAKNQGKKTFDADRFLATKA